MIIYTLFNTQNLRTLQYLFGRHFILNMLLTEFAYRQDF